MRHSPLSWAHKQAHEIKQEGKNLPVPQQIYQEVVHAGLMQLSGKDKVEIKCTVEEGKEAQTLPRAWGQ